MNEPPMMPSALGIETVQWLAEGGENLTVRISGRWRRGRPTWSGQPLLVVEAQGQRHRFPAMPEPPSLTGAAPGTWQMTFSVPASLSPAQGAHAWLQLGGAVVVPLPMPATGAEGDPTAERAAADPVANPQLLAERRLRSAELAAETARQRADRAEVAARDLAREVERLERELEGVRREPERLGELLIEREQQLRAVRQRAHAEHAIRLELQAELGARVASEGQTGGEDREGSVHAWRVRELEEEVETLRRAADEAQHTAQAAQTARSHAEERLAEAAEPTARSEHAAAIADRLREEAAVARRTAAVSLPRAVAPVNGVAGHDRELVRGERELVEARLSRGPESVSESVAAMAPVAPGGAEPELEQVLAELREELGRLRADAEREQAARVAAEAEVEALRRQLGDQTARAEQAWQEIETLRAELVALAAAAGVRVEKIPAPPALSTVAEEPVAPEPSVAAETVSVEPERFAEALARLRAAAPPPEPDEPAEPEPTAEAAEAPLASAPEAPPAAAREAPPAAAPGTPPAAAPGTPPATAPEAPPATAPEVPPAGSRWLERGIRDVARADRPAATELLTALAPDLELNRDRLAKRMGAGPIRRGLQRVTFRRAVPARLRATLRSHPSYAELELGPRLSLVLAGVLIDRGRTSPDSFTIAYQRPEKEDPGLYLQVWERDRTMVKEEAPSGRLATTIVCPPAVLISVLAGARPESASITGEERPLELVRAWIDRAQSD
ncbi:MAG TPA: hypothetical protein VGI87_07275 [Solirubrobacteraceae bacterium]